MLRLAFLLLVFLTVHSAAVAQDSQSLIAHTARVCDAVSSPTTPPDFNEARCQSLLLYEADPQNRMIWVEVAFEAEPALLKNDRPLGLFLSAKASSEASLNGVAIGNNGKPGSSQLSEQPGAMDAVFFVPEGTLQAGTNRLVMRMSAMNGDITLNSPIHNIVLAPYRDPRQPGAATWFALITFGLFVAGFVFFGVSALRGRDRQGSATIAALSLAAALQLAAEAARDIIPYPYPLHDLRLTLILTFAIGLGLSFAAHVLLAFFRDEPRRRLLALATLLAVMLLIAVFVQGFDLKTGGVLIAASLAAAITGFLSAMNGNPSGRWVALACTALAALIWWLGGLFLDTALYLILAAYLLWLFFNHARGTEQQQVQASEPETAQRIELSSNGKVEFINAADIVRFSGAGDYVEVFLDTGRSALHSASLTALEKELSDGFIRVHRSHIVNSEYVKSLTRESAGTGELMMSDGSAVPVSRRNMASVRGALKAP